MATSPPFRRIVLVATTTVALFALAAFVLPKAWFYLRAGRNVSTLRTNDLKFIARYRADVVAAEPVSVALQYGATRDAGAYLNDTIAWTNQATHRGRLTLPQQIIEKVDNVGKRWATDLTVSELSGLDFGWMARLADFDHWNFHAPARAYKGSGLSEGHWRDYDVPHFKTLQVWAKLRLIKGRNDGDVDRASAEVRQLARLVFSGETLTHSVVAISLLSIERTFYDAESKHARSDPDRHKQFARSDLEATRRACLAEPGLFHPVSGAATIRSIFGVQGKPVCGCAAVFEVSLTGLHYNRIERRTMDREAEDAMDEVVRDSVQHCRTSTVASKWLDDSWRKDGKDGRLRAEIDKWIVDGPRWLRIAVGIDAWRLAFIRVMIAENRFDPWKSYGVDALALHP